MFENIEVKKSAWLWSTVIYVA